MTERWAPVPEYEGRYEVSDLGNFRSYVARKGRIEAPVPRRIGITRCGRAIVVLCRSGTAQSHSVPRLILRAFVGEPPSPTHEAAHNDGDPLNNRLTNLRWATHMENESDKRRHGTLLFGSRNPAHKVSADMARDIREQRGVSQRALAEKHGVSQRTIGRVLGRSEIPIVIES